VSDALTGGNGREEVAARQTGDADALRLSDKPPSRISDPFIFTWRGEEIHFASYETYVKAFDLYKVRCRTLVDLVRHLKVFDVRPEMDWRWIEAWKERGKGFYVA